MASPPASEATAAPSMEEQAALRAAPRRVRPLLLALLQCQAQLPLRRRGQHCDRRPARSRRGRVGATRVRAALRAATRSGTHTVGVNTETRQRAPLQPYRAPRVRVPHGTCCTRRRAPERAALRAAHGRHTRSHGPVANPSRHHSSPSSGAPARAAAAAQRPACAPTASHKPCSRARSNAGRVERGTDAQRAADDTHIVLVPP
jgi:hypothetical protein